MSRGALVVGATGAGIQAALDLADSGIQVHLVEPSPFAGVDGDSGSAQPAFHTRLLEAARHPNLTLWTNARVSRVEGEPGQWSVELRQHPRYIDLSRCTACGDCIQACPVIVPGTQRRAIHLAHGAQPGCAAIDKLGKAPCSNTCPGGIHVQGYVALTAQGRFQEALDLIREAIPFPGICGRICTHPCEINCRRAEVDSPVAIRLLKRFLSDWELGQPAAHPSVVRPAPCPPAGQRVAVVGAGPGGMATADRLARMGYQVTVFEKLPVIGGMMAVGIPEYRLPREVIDREYRLIQDLGVEVRLNTGIGPGGDYTLDDLFALGYRAVCLAIGAHRGHSLRIPGEELPGVVQGIEMLQTISFSHSRIPAAGSAAGSPGWGGALEGLLRRGTQTRAAVLGGGNTAMDVSRSLRRLGLHEVRVLYRRSRPEMPAMPEEVEDAEREGVEIEMLVSPVRILGDPATGVTGLECLRMKLGEPDSSGRRRPVPIAGSEFLLDVDLVVLAIGQAPDLEFLGPDTGVTVTREERINVDGISFMTSRPGVFACGDAVTSDKMAVIEAVGLGKLAAAGIDAYLRGIEPHELVVDARQVPIARRELEAPDLVLRPRIPVPTLPMEQRLLGYGEVELGYNLDQATAEAQRCLVCGPCSECQACVRACKAGAVVHDQHETLTTLEIGAVLVASADAAGSPGSTAESALERVEALRVDPGDRLSASAMAAQAMVKLSADRLIDGSRARPSASPLRGRARGSGPRVGVFVCECGGHISAVVDAEALCRRALDWPGVVHSQAFEFSCSPEAAAAVERTAAAHGLDAAVLAACSCCALDQACDACTYQRVRCKTNLAVLPAPVARPRPGAVPPVRFEFVNIREQCAWIHADYPREATAKAMLLTAAAVARAACGAARPAEGQPAERSVLTVGSGPAARAAVQALALQGIAARPVRGVPASVERARGRYQVITAGGSWEAAALILAPTAPETELLLAAFRLPGHRPRPHGLRGLPDTHRPGIFLCEPGSDAATAGAAAAARAAAWLGQAEARLAMCTTSVDPARCRACGTCVQICEFGAPELCGQDPQRSAWIDPLICTGCGTCAAHCPSGAIAAGAVTEAQIDAALTVLAAPEAVVVFTCNWGAYSALESAGLRHLPYPTSARPVRLTCLGQLTPATVLRAFEKGAGGVLLLGCPESECHYGFGGRGARQLFSQTRELADRLGIGSERLALDWIGAQQGEAFAARVQAFCYGLLAGRQPSLTRGQAPGQAEQ